MWIRLASFIRSHHTALSEQLAHSEAVCEPTSGRGASYSKNRIHMPARVVSGAVEDFDLVRGIWASRSRRQFSEGFSARSIT